MYALILIIPEIKQFTGVKAFFNMRIHNISYLDLDSNIGQQMYTSLRDCSKFSKLRSKFG